MSISVVFDPLRLRQPQDSIDVERLTQPHLRALIERDRDRLLGQTLYVYEPKTKIYLQQFLPDLWARAKVEELLPARLVKEEFGIEIGEIVNEVVRAADEWQILAQALKSVPRKDKWSDAETKDLLLRVFYDIPEGALPIGEEYFALTQIERIAHSSLVERLRQKLRSEIATLGTTAAELRDLRTYLLVSAVIAESAKPISHRAVLGDRAQKFASVPLKRWEEIFRYLADHRRAFLKQELEAATISPNQQETLLELMDIGRDTVFKAALQRRIDQYRNAFEAGASVEESELQFLRHHLFADELRGEIDALVFAAHLQKTIDGANGLAETAHWSEWKTFYVERIAPLLAAQEELARQGIKIPPRVTKRFAALLEKIDRAMAQSLLSEYDTIVQQRSQETVLDFAHALRRAMSVSSKSVVLFVDALSLDLWLYLRGRLEAQGLTFDEATRLSLLPTATRYTKHALFLGHSEEGFEPNREELARSLDIPESDIRFERVADRLTPSELKSLAVDGWRVLILSFNTLDERLKAPLAPGDLLKAIDDLTEKWSLLLDEIKRRNIPLLVVSDHGFRDVRGKSPASLTYGVAPQSARWALREKSEGEVPNGCVQIGNYLLAVGGQVLQSTNRRYEHGGVSWRELIVPIAIGKPLREWRAPEIELMGDQLLEQETRALRFRVMNPNDVDLTLDLTFAPRDLPLENLYLPPISGLRLAPRQSQETSFTLRVGKVEQFTKDARLDSVQMRVELNCAYRAPATTVESKAFSFSVSVGKNIRVTDRGAIEKELEDLGL